MNEAYRLSLDIGAVAATVTTLLSCAVSIPVWMIALVAVSVALIPTIARFFHSHTTSKVYDPGREEQSDYLNELLGEGFNESF